MTFSCPACQRAFNVPDSYAGRSTRCACGAALTVPAVSTRAAVAPAKPQTPVVGGLRGRRLAADEREMRATFTGANPIARLVSTEGVPAERYVIEFRVRSLTSASGEQDVHRAEVRLTNDYPRVGPKCRMLTPVFHPNIDATSICIGDHWTAGERLVDLVARIAEMLAYQAYNIRSPLNAEAAMWADLNGAKLPIDARDLRAAMANPKLSS